MGGRARPIGLGEVMIRPLPAGTLNVEQVG